MQATAKGQLLEHQRLQLRPDGRRTPNNDRIANEGDLHRLLRAAILWPRSGASPK
jgi:hypothetical protein